MLLRRHAVLRHLCAAAALCSAAMAAAAAEPAAPAAPTHPWLALPRSLPQPHSYFTNLREGERIETPYVLRFGLSRFGLAPAGGPAARAGHHHLLINRDLPLAFDRPLPFDAHYLHFGAGEMETVLDLPPGQYTLRLLTADHRHVPQFVYSRPVKVVVTKRHAQADAAALRRPGVALLAPPAGAVLRPPLHVQFHVAGHGVAPAAVQGGAHGHFRLVAERAGHAPETIDFSDGATEAWLEPPAGDYTLKLQFVRNAAPQEVLLAAAPVAVKVAPLARPD